MGLIDFLKGVWRRMFPLENIRQALNLRLAITAEMQRLSAYGKTAMSAKLRGLMKMSSV